MPWAPPGLHLTGLEGAGEVQTPLTGHPAALLRIGDLVWFRHAKSGELFEHTTTVHLLAGDAHRRSVPTYRGIGHRLLSADAARRGRRASPSLAAARRSATAG